MQDDDDDEDGETGEIQEKNDHGPAEVQDETACELQDIFPLFMKRKDLVYSIVMLYSNMGGGDEDDE